MMVGGWSGWRLSAPRVLGRCVFSSLCKSCMDWSLTLSVDIERAPASKGRQEYVRTHGVGNADSSIREWSQRRQGTIHDSDTIHHACSPKSGRGGGDDDMRCYTILAAFVERVGVKSASASDRLYARAAHLDVCSCTFVCIYI